MHRIFYRYLLLLIITGIIFQQTQAQERIKSPQLVDLNLEEAWSILNENGLTMVVTLELNTRYQPGTVFEQNPAPGETLSPGSSIKLKVATGIAEVEVPDLMKSSLDEARPLLQNKQLSIITGLKRTIEYEHGTVFEQEPPAGTRVQVGTPVRLSVADVPQMVEVPVLVGRPLGEVRAILDELDLSMGAAPELATDHSPGTVFKQNPPPGTWVPITTPVYLAVATASDVVEVPDLTGRTFEEAWKILQDAKLAAVSDPTISAEHSPGSVFAQSVTAGSKVSIGTPVTLRIATAAEKVTVSNFRGESFEETQEALRKAGLPMAITAEVNSEFTPGTIMEQSLSTGSLAAIGTPVYIKVAIAPNMVAIPNLNGQPLDVAQAMLQENGLPMVVETEKNAGYVPGTIFAQNPASGNEIHVGSPVGVTVALGPENVTVPNLSNRSLEEAGAILQESKLSMVVKTENTAGYPPGTVIEQNISGGSRVSIGSPVYLKVATDSAPVNIGSLQGRSLEEVQAILQNHRLPMIVMPQTNFDYKPGIVFEQISAPGKAVSPGVPVYVKVALDTMIVELPSCDTLKVEEAYQMLRELQLPMVTKLQLTTANRSGVVLKQNPPSGSRVPAGTPVYFEVAVGPDSVTVPGLANRPFEDAWAVCRNIRLPLVLLEEKTGEHRPGIIFEQITPPESQLPLGTPLYLKLALGRDEIEVPDLLGLPLEEARNIAADLQLPMILLPEVTTEYTPGAIVEQNLTAGIPVPPGTPLFLKVAAAAGALKLPDLAGRFLNEVRELLQEAGLQIILTDSTTEGHPPGLVLGQNPLPGSEVKAGASVVVTVAAPPPEAIEPPGWMTGIIAGIKKAMPGLIILAGMGVILIIAIVSLKILKKRRSVKNRQPEKIKVVEEIVDPEKIDIESEVHFETFPDIGRQYVEVNGPLVMLEEERLTAETESPTPTGEPTPQDEPELAEIQQLGLKITEILQATNITTFGKLAKALNVKMRLKAVPDLGRQYLQTESSLILKETDDLTAGSETAVPVAAVKSEVSGETGEIQENGRKITDLLRSSNITTFAQLTAALNFKIGLKPFPDAGKQNIRVEGSLLRKDDLRRIEGIGPKISEILRESGIVTFTQLASTDAEHLRKILEQADLPFTDPTTWPEQAKLAATDEWEALDALQEELKGGRRV